MWHNLGSRSATISDYVSSLETASSREDFKNAVKGIKAQLVVLREQLPSWKLVAATPWWAWSGGILGGVFILLVILLLPPLGAATLLALVVAGQMSAAVIMDHFGAFGLAQHPVSISRLAGVALVIAGVVLIRE